MTNAEDWTDRRLRHAVTLEAEIHGPDGHTRTVTVSNLSREGCRLEGWYRIGEEIELTLPRIGRVRGQVRWAIGGRAGVRFLSPVDGAETAEA